MSKVNTDEFKKYMDDLYKEFANTNNLKKVGDFVAERIQKRTRLGKGVDKTGADPKPLKKLSDGYVKQRAKKKSSLDSTASPRRSNLTFSGRMLAALKTLSVLPDRVIVGIEASSRKDSLLKNDEVAGFVSKDRPFLNLSKAELNGVSDFIRKLLSSFIRRT